MEAPVTGGASISEGESQIFPGTGRPQPGPAGTYGHLPVSYLPGNSSSGFGHPPPVAIPSPAQYLATTGFQQPLSGPAAAAFQQPAWLTTSPPPQHPEQLRPTPALYAQMPMAAPTNPPAPQHPPTLIRDKVQVYEIFGHVINFDKGVVTVQTAGSRDRPSAQYLCALREEDKIPIEAGDIFHGLALPPAGVNVYRLIAQPKVMVSYTDAVLMLPFRLALGVKWGNKVYEKLRANYKDPKDLSETMDLFTIQKRPSKPHDLTWKQWKKVLAAWRRHRSHRQLYLWGMTEEQVDDFLDLAKCTIAEAMEWLKNYPEAIFTLSQAQILSIRERNGLSQSEDDRKMRTAIVEMYADLKNGYLSIPSDADCLQALPAPQRTLFQKIYPVYVLGGHWYLRYPGMVVDGIRKFLRETKNRIVREHPPFVTGEMKLSSGRTIRISSEQSNALSKCLRQPFTIINGPAGTGKTTILRALYNYCKSNGLSIIVSAFTGKATARDREVLSSEEPCTLDLLCQMTTPGTLDVDFLCIDEVSQCSMELFYRVLCLFMRPPQVVLIGDPNQLPPIKWGPLLDSLLESGYPVEYLTEVHRHKDAMLVNPHLVLQGLPLELNSACIHFPAANDEAAMGCVRDLFQMILGDGRWTPWDITVVSPYDYVAGKTNEIVGRLLFSNSHQFNVGDRIVMTDNCYDIEIEPPEGTIRDPNQDPKTIAKGSLFNGEEGKIIVVTGEHVIGKFGEKSYKFKWETENPGRRWKKWGSGEEDVLTTKVISRAYGVTVDRSQGSEWPFVVVYFPRIQRNATFIDRRRLYTALTRGKDCIFLIGNIGEYHMASARMFESKTVPLCDG